MFDHDMVLQTQRWPLPSLRDTSSCQQDISTCFARSSVSHAFDAVHALMSSSSRSMLLSLSGYVRIILTVVEHSRSHSTEALKLRLGCLAPAHGLSVVHLFGTVRSTCQHLERSAAQERHCRLHSYRLLHFPSGSFLPLSAAQHGTVAQLLLTWLKGLSPNTARQQSLSLTARAPEVVCSYRRCPWHSRSRAADPASQPFPELPHGFQAHWAGAAQPVHVRAEQ